jgi:L-aminopeptidase/D-esterase-like protein
MKTILNSAGGSLVDIEGLWIGQHEMSNRLTGCSVVVAPQGAVCGIDVRGAAPGTRESDLLDPSNLVDKVHAVMLCGGSAYGLAAATGAMQWLEEQGIGLETGHGRVPIVPAAVLFDLALVRPGDDPLVRPDAACGYAACAAASGQTPASGNVGAGAGAAVGKLFGPDRAMKGGIGHACVQVGPWRVGAMMACNAVGDVVEPGNGSILAGARTADGRALLGTVQALLDGERSWRPLPGTNTTIGVVATNARLDKAQARRLAMSAHDGMARCIRPVHTILDGDTVFAMATGTSALAPDPLLLGVMAAEATEQALIAAVKAARTVQTISGLCPAAADFGT